MSKIKIILFVVIAVAFIMGGMWFNNKLDGDAANDVAALEAKAAQADAQALATIQIKDVALGTGVEAKKGDTISVHYLGQFMDGKKFDSSYDRHQPFDFVLGGGAVIRGWDLALVGMKVGGKRTLVVPADLAYGPSGYGPIPPSSTLKFTVELVGVNAATSTVK